MTILKAVPALLFLYPCLGHADTLAQVTAPYTLTASVYVGESFTVLGSGAYSDIVFNFGTVAGTPYAVGTAYLFDRLTPYYPTDLKPSLPGYVGSAVAQDNFYRFDSSVVLDAGKQYYLFEDQLVPTNTLGGGSFYNGGASFGAYTLNDFYKDGFQAVSFDVTGSSVGATATTPEPSSVALLATGLLGVAGIARRRFI